MVDNMAAMGYETLSAVDNAPADTEIELLVRETRAPLEVVRKLYTREHAKLERTAKIKTFVPILIHSRVKALLQEQRYA
jgi:hypothetical protein